MLCISERYTIIKRDVGITSDKQLYLRYMQYLKCRPTAGSFQLLSSELFVKSPFC